MNETKYSFPKTRRLRQKEDFDRIFKQAVRRSTGGITIRVLTNSMPFCRLGLMIGKKAGNAVTRNRVRRVLREHFRYAQHEMREASDVVVTVYGSLRDVSNSDVKNVFSELLTRF